MVIERITAQLKTVCPNVIYMGDGGDIKKLPLIAWFITHKKAIYADNEPYIVTLEGVMELYTKGIDFFLEEKLEQVFIKNRIAFCEEDRDYIHSERVHVVKYKIEFSKESEDTK